MKYLIALFLLVSPGFTCEHRSSFLHKTPDFKLLFWGLHKENLSLIPNAPVRCCAWTRDHHAIAPLGYFPQIQKRPF